MNDFVYPGGNSQINIELPFKTWVKQPYDGNELIIMADAITYSDLYDQQGTLQFSFKMTYKLVAYDNHLVSNKKSQSDETRKDLFDEIDSSDSVDSDSVSSAPIEFEDFVMHGSPFKIHEHLISENYGLKKENDVLRSVIAYLESEINVFKFRDNQHKHLFLVLDALEKENTDLQSMNFRSQTKLKKNKAQERHQEASEFHTLKTEKNNLVTNIQTLKSEMKRLEKQHMSDKKIIEDLTLKCEIGYFDCKNEQHKLLGLELQAYEMENENLNAMIFDLESEMRKIKLRDQQHQQLILRNQQLEQEKRNMNFVICDQSYEIENLKATIMTEKMLAQRNLRETRNSFDDFNTLNRVWSVLNS